jgi:thiol-disulfide isomerase/thioredoxin
MTKLGTPQLLIILTVACVVCRIFADDTKSIVMVEAETYIHLDSEKHLAALDDPDIWLVEFFSPMCGSCADFKPTWNEVASALHGQVMI